MFRPTRAVGVEPHINCNCNDQQTALISLVIRVDDAELVWHLQRETILENQKYDLKKW